MPIMNKVSLSSKITNTQGEQVDVGVDSNILAVNNATRDILIINSANKSWVLPEEELLIKVSITNNMNTNIEDFNLQAVFSDDISFVAKSVYVNSTNYPDINMSDGGKFPITIGMGADCEITYKIIIGKYIQDAEATISSILKFNVEGQEISVNSSNLTLEVLINELTALKSANTSVAVSGSELIYTVLVTNSGQYTNTDIRFVDNLPSEVEFVDGSVEIDGTSQPTYSVIEGFALKDLATNETTQVQFKVRVK